MGRTIQFESRTNERRRIVLFENDPQVLEFWDQPPQIQLSFITASGRRHTDWFTLDFFVIENFACGWVECKMEEELEKLAISSPNRYQKQEDGTWISPPGQKYADNFGFFFKILSSKSISPILSDNLDYLDDYLREDTSSVPEQITRSLKKLVIAKPGIQLSELKAECPKAEANDFNILIARGELYVDLALAPLNAPERVRVFPDAAQAKLLEFLDQSPRRLSPLTVDQLHEGAKIRLGERQLIVSAILSNGILFRDSTGSDVRLERTSIGKLVEEGQIEILSSESLDVPADLKDFLGKCSREAREEGLRRYEIFRTPAEFAKIKERTRERWRSKVRNAEARWPGYGWVGLISTYHEGGRRPVKLSPQLLEVLETAFQSYENKAAITFAAFYALCCALAETKGVGGMCCRQKVKAWLVARCTPETTAIREGTKVMKAESPPVPVDPDALPEAKRPWELAYIDHTKADIQLLLDGKVLTDETKRPWLSVMLDGYSKKVLAFVITFNSPNRDTNMHLIRECVRLHRRLPSKLAMDNGKDFKSTYFQKLMTAFWITPEYRPPSIPRFGAQIERWFGTANTKAFHQMLGNTKAMKNPRQVTKEVNPSNTAVWTLEGLHERLSEFCYVIYNDGPHSSLNCSPNEKFKQGIKEHGEREERKRAYDDEFIKMTFPSTQKGTVTVGRNGVRVFGFSYWANGMERLKGAKLPVCFDPMDISRVYVFMNKRWEWAKSGSHQIIERMSRKQLEIASKELCAEQKSKGQLARADERRFGTFIQSGKGQEVLAEQRKVDAAFDAIQQKLNSTTPVANSVDSQQGPSATVAGPNSAPPPALKTPRKLITFELPHENE